jgi:hypothetical protein
MTLYCPSNKVSNFQWLLVDRMRSVLQVLLVVFFLSSLSSCSALHYLQAPKTKEMTVDRFEEMTGHTLLDVCTKEDALGYLYDNGVFVKKIWGGRVQISPTGQTIKLAYTKESFDKLKLFLGNDFNVGSGLENVHHVYIYFEDVQKFDLVDFQPMIEYMGKNNIGILKKKFVVSMIKVSSFRVEAFRKIKGEFGTEFQPYPLTKAQLASGVTSTKQEEQSAYNVFVGYKLYAGKDWIIKFDKMPKMDVNIASPEKDQVIDRVRTRVRGKISNYEKLSDKYKNQMWLYLMVRDEYEDNWLLQKRATVNDTGDFEGIVHLGSLESGDGHRYSIAAFVTYFKINRDVNSVIPILPFNKGKDIISVSRKDSF